MTGTLPRRPNRVQVYDTVVLGGAAILLKQTLAPLALAALYALSSKQERPLRHRLALFGVAGLAIPLGLLAARNIAAGVPPLTFDTRQAIGLAWGNGRGANATTAIPPSMKAILDAAQGGTAQTAAVVLSGYRDAPLDLLFLWLKKFVTFFNAFEVPDNASFYYFRDRLALLRVLPVFICLFGVGIVGLSASFWRGSLRRAEFALATIAVLTPLAACLLVQTTSRYRVAVASPLALGAGLFVFLLLEAWRRRAMRSAMILAVSAAALTGVPLLPSVIPGGHHRFADALVGATLAERIEGPSAGAREISRYVSDGADDPNRAVGLVSVEAWLDGRRGTNLAPEGVAPPDRRYQRPK